MGPDRRAPGSGHSGTGSRTVHPAAFTAVGLSVTMFSADATGLFIGIAIAGMGQGAFISVDVAMMTEVLPTTSSAGKDLGVVALSYQLPQVLVPVLATPLLAIGSGGPNYVALYAAAALLSLLGAAAVLPIKGVR